MKWASLKTKLLLLLLFLTVNSVSSQEEQSVNVVLIIDDKLITDNIVFNFNKNESENFEYIYSVGKSLVLPKSFFNSSKLNLSFDYFGTLKENQKKYSYDIDFKKGWIHNTSFLIIRIYNLDKKKYYKAFCKSKDKYVIEVHNSVYRQTKPMCKKLKNTF
ncbi:hypothetical protein [Mesonia hippocampi]|uniref:hypothetical protein n=1 Tax=Mesonia hippocampi TaxID=1628250 RepID=UPI003F955868